MTQSSTTKSRVPQVFTVRRGRDGTEDAYNIVYVPTGQTIAAFLFWDNDPDSLRGARQLAKALSYFAYRGGRIYDDEWIEVGHLIDGELAAVTGLSLQEIVDGYVRSSERLIRGETDEPEEP